MNEKIKLLAAEARGHMVVLPRAESQEQWQNQMEEFCQKFGELIVRDCLAQVEGARNASTDHNQIIGANNAGLAIAKYFSS
ncbi:hypothetical protein UFOVP1636_51 [uncultured Caudovirales phage]|uniref:Uncharacterized protein n=1 Tax=uncultured Caudovirales phage TaxID=2100421 RepID=A0A6J5SZH8_9CAUD|nr:hypothetical protein UFOVP1636_51 [uncultured Caudovirales phage]